MRFLIVGASNTAITLIAYAIAIRTGVRYLPAGAVAYSLGGVNGFVLNRTWTFAHRGRIFPAAARYAAVTAIGVAANLALLHAAISAGVPHWAGEIAAVAPVTLVSFALNRAWAFAVHVESLPPAPLAGRRPDGRRRPARRRGADPAAAGDGRG